jgi:hypothetical protein
VSNTHPQKEKNEKDIKIGKDKNKNKEKNEQKRGSCPYPLETPVAALEQLVGDTHTQVSLSFLILFFYFFPNRFLAGSVHTHRRWPPA